LGAENGNFKHGHAARQADGRRCSPEYYSWMAMNTRCGNPRAVGWKNYGGRGIRVLYPSFEAFLADVGRRLSPAHSIDRIDPDGHYEPGNVRWATRLEQARDARGRAPWNKGLKAPDPRL